VDLIAGFGERLWKDLVGSGSKQDGSLPFSVTTISLGFSGVEPGEAGQQSIEGFFRPGASTKPPSSPDGHDGEVLQIGHGKRRLESEDGEGSSLDMLDINQENMVSFLCPRCRKRIEVEFGNNAEGEPEQRRAEALTRLRMEHGDFHVAEDLSKVPYDGNLSVSPGLRVVERERKRKKESNARKDKQAEGIAKFLVRKPG
jgi:DNA polymerase eta